MLLNLHKIVRSDCIRTKNSAASDALAVVQVTVSVEPLLIDVATVGVVTAESYKVI